MFRSKKFNKDFEIVDEKKRYKLYKSGKNWVKASNSQLDLFRIGGMGEVVSSTLSDTEELDHAHLSFNTLAGIGGILAAGAAGFVMTQEQTVYADETSEYAEKDKTVIAAEPKAAETTVARPNTSDNEKPSDKPADLAEKPTIPVAGTDRSAVATPAKEDTKAAETKKQAVKEEKAATTTKTEAEKPKQQTPAAPATGSREEQIRKAFLAKVAQLRNINGLPALSENAALNSSSKYRSADVTTRGIDGNIHGPNGSIQYEKDAAKAAGYLNSILANIAITSDSGTPEQVAQQLFDILFKEIGNVVAAYPYGHRNTLLDATAKDVGAGVTIKNGQVYLVQHQSSNGAFNGTTPKAGKYLDGLNTIYRNGQPV